MGRPPSNGGPAFRFTQIEVAEMEGILQEHQNQMPAREILVALADKFSETPERKGKIMVQMKQVWNWFQNRRYAIRAKLSKSPGKFNVTPMSRDDLVPLRNVPQPSAAPIPAPMSAPLPAPVPASVPVPSVSSAGRVASENSSMEFEAKSARDGAWYDVATFIAHRTLDTADSEVQVRFAGFGPEEDEWVNVKRHVRQRSLPCEASECVAVLPGDLILCFQEGKDQALYFDAHVLDAQRRRHDVRGCRCRFLVRYDHDQSEEIVPLRKVCRRPETDYRLQQLHAMNDSASADQQKPNTDSSTAGAPRGFSSPAEMMQKLGNANVVRVALAAPGAKAAQVAQAAPVAQPAPVAPAVSVAPVAPVASVVAPAVPVAQATTVVPTAPVVPVAQAIAEVPAAPVAQASPVVPSALVAPVAQATADVPAAPVAQASPVVPSALVTSVAQATTDVPAPPVDPVPQATTVVPAAPVASVAQATPVDPAAPLAPVAQATPVVPAAPVVAPAASVDQAAPAVQAASAATVSSADVPVITHGTTLDAEGAGSGINTINPDVPPSGDALTSGTGASAAAPADSSGNMQVKQ